MRTKLYDSDHLNPYFFERSPEYKTYQHLRRRRIPLIITHLLA